MASLSGWIFVIIGGFVSIWSYFQENLLFFTVVGAVMALYGISKIVIARAFKKSELTNDKPAVSGQRNHAHAQMQTYVQQPRQNVNQVHQQAQMHHRPGSPVPPQTHLPSHSHQAHVARPAQQHAQPVHHAHMHQPQTAYKVCPNCKKQMHVAYRFCPHCGWGV